jgi:hypothetical protein
MKLKFPRRFAPMRTWILDREAAGAVRRSDPGPGGRRDAGLSRLIVRAAWVVAPILPLVGLFSLVLRRHLDPAWDDPRLHFVLFLTVGGGAFVLAYIAGQAADRRGDARVFLLSLAFLVTGGFLAVHAVGTPGVLITNERPGFMVAIPVGLLIAALFAGPRRSSMFGRTPPPSSFAIESHCAARLSERSLFGQSGRSSDYRCQGEQMPRPAAPRCAAWPGWERSSTPSPPSAT